MLRLETWKTWYSGVFLQLCVIERSKICFHGIFIVYLLLLVGTACLRISTSAILRKDQKIGETVRTVISSHLEIIKVETIDGSEYWIDLQIGREIAQIASPNTCTISSPAMPSTLRQQLKVKCLNLCIRLRYAVSNQKMSVSDQAVKSVPL